MFIKSQQKKKKTNENDHKPEFQILKRASNRYSKVGKASVDSKSMYFRAYKEADFRVIGEIWRFPYANSLARIIEVSKVSLFVTELITFGINPIVPSCINSK